MASSEMLILALLIAVCTNLVCQNYAQDTCGTIGSNNESMVTRTTDRMLYLNVVNPAPCTGSITSWKVCYYGPNSTISSFRIRSYWATYAVYRKMGTGVDEHYVRVSEVFKAVRASAFAIRYREGNVADGPIRGGFRCYTDSIDNETSSVIVQTGDVLGVCVFNPVNQGFLIRSQLDVVGESSGSSLLATTTDGCSMDTLPSNIPTSQLSVLNSRRLHIHTNMGPIVVQPTSKPVVPTVVSVTFPSSTTLSTVATSDSNSTKSTNQGKTSQVSASISPTCTMSCYTASSAVNTHSSAGHYGMRSTPAPKHSSEANPPAQQVKVIGIAVGSTCGVLILTAMLVTLIAITVCLMLKKRKKALFDFSTNIAYSKRTVQKVYNSAIVTEENTAYASSPNLSTANKGVDVEYESFHESTSTEFYSEAKRASTVDSLSLVTDKNIAYEPSLFSNISLMNHFIRLSNRC